MKRKTTLGLICLSLLLALSMLSISNCAKPAQAQAKGLKNTVTLYGYVPKRKDAFRALSTGEIDVTFRISKESVQLLGELQMKREVPVTVTVR